MIQERVLSLLRSQEGDYVSGEEMSRTLGVSRAAVWKAIAALREEGYQIHSSTRRGYCLGFAPDRIREGELKGPLAGCRVGRELVCLETVDSTNTECKRRALTGAAEGLVVLSEEQSAGRGRLGRSFQSPRGTGLYLSALLRPRLSPEQVSSLTAWTAVAVCQGIQRACGLTPRIKWTNDIVLEGRKVCGILTELGLESETNSLEYLVVGIGVNVNQRLEDFDPELRDFAGSLSMSLGRPVRRGELAAEIIRALDRMYAAFPQGKQPYLEAYRNACLTVGQEVQLITPASRRQARALEIDEEFRLVVEYPDGAREALSAGEVSVRGMYGYV